MSGRTMKMVNAFWTEVLRAQKVTPHVEPGLTVSVTTSAPQFGTALALLRQIDDGLELLSGYDEDGRIILAIGAGGNGTLLSLAAHVVDAAPPQARQRYHLVIGRPAQRLDGYLPMQFGDESMGTHEVLWTAEPVLSDDPWRTVDLTMYVPGLTNAERTQPSLRAMLVTSALLTLLGEDCFEHRIRSLRWAPLLDAPADAVPLDALPYALGVRRAA